MLALAGSADVDIIPNAIAINRKAESFLSIGSAPRLDYAGVKQ
jgi:hypothetical protein